MIEKALELMNEHWGELSDKTFDDNAEIYFQDIEAFNGLCALAQSATLSENPKAIGSLMMAALKVAYDLGRGSMLQ